MELTSAQPLPLAAVVGGPEARQVIHAFVGKLRDRGLKVGGQMQETLRDASGYKTEMALVDLLTGQRFVFSQKLGRGSTSCGINEQVLGEAGQALRRTVEDHPDLLVMNKFSHLECEGRGFRAEFAALAASGIPLLCQVPEGAIDGWLEFCGGLGTTLPARLEQLEDWWDSVFPEPSVTGSGC